MFYLMGIIVGATILLLIILYIASLFTSRNYSYEQMEEVMQKAAISYFKEHPEQLPTNDGDVVEIDAANLVVAGKMKSLGKYRSDGVTCSGSVQVRKSGTEYIYTPLLDCGSSYMTVSLSEKVLNDNSPVTTGDGLYQINGDYIFRGENIKNYVQLEKSLWRVVKITGSNNVVLIHSESLDYSQPWDNRFNETRNYESGINSYSVSRMKEYLDKIYTNPKEDDGELILSEKDKTKIIPFDLCIGGRTTSSEGKNNTEECGQKLQNQRLGLLTLSDYLYASLDTNCKSANTKSCMNYNYLVLDDEWWLVTPNKEDTSTVFKVDRNGIVKADIAGTYSNVRPIIYLNNNVKFDHGSGTLEDPYYVK